MKLTVTDGSFGYNAAENVFDNVNFEVNSGEMLAILGPNGAGKTTLLRCIMGMLKWKKGASFIDGININSMSDKKLWSIASYVPQAKNTVSSLSVTDCILLGLSAGLSFFRQPIKSDYEKVEGVLKSLGIEKLKDKSCDEISGGELQMVLIARALVSEPQILILDEPESNLDFKNQLIVLDTMSSLVSKGMACVFNTHYPEHALQRADKALIISSGKTLFGTANETVNEENIEKAFAVKAIIGETETDNMIYKNVLPLRVTHGSPLKPDIKTEDIETLATVSIIINSFDSSQKVSSLLHEYSDMIVGRMGLPYKRRGLYIINTVFDGKKKRIDELTHRLSVTHGVSVKTIYSNEEGEDHN